MMDNDEEMMVSICCITYNHEDYIADSIEGFLMQETDFKYEVIIHDDASTDKTADIIRSYELKYPELIKPIYQNVNQYSKNIKILPTFLYPSAKGKYIALCEGDDYWTDPKKLQIQFECLEKNSDAVCCFHDEKRLDNEGFSNQSRIAISKKRSFTSSEMMGWKAKIFPLTVFFRNIEIFRNYPPEASYVKNGDAFLNSILGQYGHGIYLPMIKPSVYRVHEGGIWSMKSEREQKAMRLNTAFWLAEYYSRLGNHKFEEKFRIKCLVMVISDLLKYHLLLEFLRSFPQRFVKLCKDVSKKFITEK
ncbi:MAG: glycosyltransferase [Methanolobus sp.]|jgi:glycosyltransferase involved in cell wall biosynthesis|nr:glycosyltransferase [Methanolobus sp.]